MSKGQKIPRDLALTFAKNLIEILAPAVTRIEIAGSLRREKKEVGDIEIVCILAPAHDLLGMPYSDPDRINRLVADAGWHMGKSGDKFKEIRLGPIKADLFITTPDQWGFIFMLRTGCGEFSKLMVTPRKSRGLMPSNYHAKDGRLWQGRRVVPVPEEADLFKLYGMPIIPPKLREPGYLDLIRQSAGREQILGVERYLP